MDTPEEKEPMPREQVCFKKRKRYKYTLVEEYSTHIEIKSQADIDKRFIGLTRNGDRAIKEGYAWDGPSAPTIAIPPINS